MNKNLPLFSRSGRYLWGLLCCCLVFLTGCVKYDVGITFNHQHRGTITQYVQLGEQLASFSPMETKAWLGSFQTKAKQLGGKAKLVSPRELRVTIPFNNGQELRRKFNQFFNDGSTPESSELVALNSTLDLQQSNFIVADRDHLKLTVDLTELGIESEEGNLLVSSGSLVDIGLTIATPWGSNAIVNGVEMAAGQALDWQLQPGQINELEMWFWTPSYLGMGSIAIIGLVALGYGLKKYAPAKS